MLRPDLGRQFDDESRERLSKGDARDCDIQIAIGDGLSVAAVAEQVPHLLPLLLDGAKARGWTVGRAFVVRHCRVGILNEIGELLKPRVAVLLIGERPGLATAKQSFGVHGVSSYESPHRREPQPDFEYSRARH